MFKKYLTFALTFLVLNLSLSSVAFAETKEEKAAKFAEKVKVNVTKLGTGTDARVEVKLKDGKKLKGYISQINDESFTIVEDKTGVATEIPYPQPKQIKGNNLSTGATIAIAAGIVFALAIIIYFVSGQD